jgi:hypothetical protein
MTSVMTANLQNLTHTTAWIETRASRPAFGWLGVAPRVGAWIET